jgi:hypothetical protein
MSCVSALLAGLVTGVPCVAQPIGCIPPIRPFLPSDPRDVRAYADLLRQDFETYIADFGAYLQCLDAERARVFEEGQEVTQEYGRLRDLTARLRPSESAD